MDIVKEELDRKNSRKGFESRTNRNQGRGFWVVRVLTRWTHEVGSALSSSKVFASYQSYRGEQDGHGGSAVRVFLF